MRLASFFFVLSAFCLSSPSSIRAEDLVEFLSGAKASGTVKSIRKVEKEFDIEVTIGGRTSVRTYPFAKVHAVNHLVEGIKKSHGLSVIAHHAAEHISAGTGELHRALHASGNAGLGLIALVDHRAVGALGKGGGFDPGA